MSSGDLQACSCSASGCRRMFFFVFCSYAFKAALKTDRKLEDDVDVDVDGA